MIDVKMQIYGNCGKVHKSFQGWRLCKACDPKNTANLYERWWCDQIVKTHEK